MIRLQELLYTSTSLLSVAIILTACPNNQTATTSPNSAVTTTPLPQTESLASVNIPGVTNVGEINFKTTSTGVQGFFDAVNGSNAAKVEVSRTNPTNIYGWAILANKGRPADNVIITYGDNNIVVAVATVNVERPDVAKVLNNSALANSGWNINFETSTLPEGSIILKAWAYDSETKEATQLTNTREITIN
ncbi:hypothetical protein BWI75_10125 [Gloeocapsopsis sp. AAB1 = 1H9]|uniref:Uncharacterized protein n=2 Tax=Gloeocapsopsis TaxID=693222 RepID=A0A6N8FV95_9CHRO|nr:hypothetical protein [Gloeocapsopsis dulcis AAB1 = 1H9]